MEATIQPTSISEIPSFLLEQITKQVIEAERPKIELDYKAKMARELDAIRIENEERIRKAVDDFMLDWKKQQEPLKPDEIQQLLNQEYAEFSFKMFIDGKQKEFKIRELPQAIEKKFYSVAKVKLIDKTQELAALSFRLLDGDIADKLRGLMELFEPAFDVLAEAAAYSLDPKQTEITPEWVQNNLNSHRILMIVKAQMEANKLRDFFLQLFQLSNQSKTTSQVPAQR